jgi:hypothetical protein
MLMSISEIAEKKKERVKKRLEERGCTWKV